MASNSAPLTGRRPAKPAATCQRKNGVFGVYLAGIATQDLTTNENSAMPPSRRLFPEPTGSEPHVRPFQPTRFRSAVDGGGVSAVFPLGRRPVRRPPPLPPPSPP